MRELLLLKTEGGVGEEFPHVFGVTATEPESTAARKRHRGKAPMGSERRNIQDKLKIHLQLLSVYKPS